MLQITYKIRKKNLPVALEYSSHIQSLQPKPRSGSSPNSTICDLGIFL